MGRQASTTKLEMESDEEDSDKWPLPKGEPEEFEVGKPD